VPAVFTPTIFPLSAAILRMRAAELAHGPVELLGSLEAADMTGTEDDDEPRVRDRLLELSCDAER
jgi:hypothetical protein